MKNLNILLDISEKAGLFGEFSSSTVSLAKELNTSQQTVSRKLRELEADKLIIRNVSPDGIAIALSDKGRQVLESHYLMLKKVFDSNVSLKGNLVSGLNEGKYYVGINGYKKQFKEKLGITPFEGTLNLKVEGVELKKFLVGAKPVVIGGFSTKQRSYGSIKAHKIKINNMDAAIIFPERSLHGEDVVEIIAEFNVRKKMGLKDGDKVEIKK